MEKKTNFFTFWLDNIRTSFLLIFLIILAGAFSLYTIPKESSPDIKFGIINVAVTYPGVNPEDMDSLVTEKIENEIEDLDGIKKISSTSSVGTSLLTVELDTGVDTRDMLTDIKDKVDKVDLPEDASDPTVVEVSSNNTLIYEALIYGDEEKFDDFSLMKKAKLIQSALEGKHGIASIDVGGISDLRWGASGGADNDYEIKVLLSKSKVELLGLSINNIVSSIKSNNKDTPIGNYKVGNLNYDFRFEGELASVDELKNVVIKDDGNSQIKLKDVAEFSLEYKGDSVSRLGFYKESGNNYTSLVFNKGNGANVFSSSRSSKQALEYLLANDPEYEGLSVEYSKDMSAAIIEDYGNLSDTAITTIVLVFITIMFFVGLREGIIASLLLPLAFMVTFIVLDILGLSLNFLTNFSLVLTLGIAIDTVIVIIEGASEKMKLGFSRFSAIIIAVRDFRAPLIAGTATTLVAFLPLMFLPGIVGRFLSFIPITVFATLLAALLLSLTVSSALFVKLMKQDKTFHKDLKVEANMRDSDKELLIKDRADRTEKDFDNLSMREKLLNKLGKTYENFLHGIFNKTFYKLSFVLVPVILLIFSFAFLSPKIGFILFPGSDEGVINIDIKGPVGSDEEHMVKYIEPVDKVLSSIEEMKVYYITVSGNGLSVYIDLLDRTERDDMGLKSVFEVEKDIDMEFNTLRSEGLEVSVGALKGGPPTGSAVGIKLTTDSAKKFDILKAVSDDFKKHLESLEGSKNVISSSSDAPGQFVFQFDKNKLSNVGLTQDDILNELYFYTNGQKAGSIKSDFEDNDIVVSFKEFEEYLNPTDIENIVLNTRIGKVRVGDFTNFEFKKAVNAITREDGKIIVSIGSEVEEGVLPTDIQPLLDEFASEYSFPEGITYIKGGESQENMDIIVSTIKSFFIAVFLIFSILVFQFNSFKQPLIVLYSIILALLGVNIGLFLTGNPYSMPFGIGFIALTGIVVNDAIILIDKINKSIRNEEEKNTGNIDYISTIITAGKTRLQPIIVTTLTTVFGVLPLALQDEFWAGLGFTIIFGLFVGSFMTLVVVPLLYQMMVVRKKG